MRARGRIAATGVALALALIPTAGLGATLRVKAVGNAPGDFAWRPMTTHANKGDKVVFKNRSNTTHHVAAYGGNWSYNETIAPDQRTSKTFRKAGTFRFRCDLPGHSTLNGDTCTGMCGKVRVH